MSKTIVFRMVCGVLIMLMAFSALSCKATPPETSTFVDEAVQLVPQDANFLAYIHLNEILNDPDFRELYKYTYEAIPEEQKSDEFPGTVEDALDMVRLATGLDLNDFSQVWIFGDSETFGEGNGYFGLLVQGDFDQSELIEAFEKSAGAEFSTEEYKGYQLYINEQEELALAFLTQDMFVLGCNDAVEDVVDIKEGQETPVSGELYDMYTSLLPETIIRCAWKIPEERKTEFREELSTLDIPIDLTSFAEINTIGLYTLKDDELVTTQLKAYFLDERYAQDFAYKVEGLAFVLRIIIDDPEVRALLDDIVARWDGANLTKINSQASIDEIKSLIDAIIELTQEGS